MSVSGLNGLVGRSFEWNTIFLVLGDGASVHFPSGSASEGVNLGMSVRTSSIGERCAAKVNRKQSNTNVINCSESRIEKGIQTKKIMKKTRICFRYFFRLTLCVKADCLHSTQALLAAFIRIVTLQSVKLAAAKQNPRNCATSPRLRSIGR